MPHLQDSKPWRLRMPPSITWFDVDQPGVIQTKKQLLADAGAADAPTHQPLQNPPSTVTSGSADTAQPAGGTEPGAAVRFPLLVDSWRPVPADLSKVSLSSCLDGRGFDPSILTVWLAEALLYYLTLDQVTTDSPRGLIDKGWQRWAAARQACQQASLNVESATFRQPASDPSLLLCRSPACLALIIQQSCSQTQANSCHVMCIAVSCRRLGYWRTCVACQSLTADWLQPALTGVLGYIAVNSWTGIAFSCG